MKYKLALGAIAMAVLQTVLAQPSLIYENDGIVQVPPAVAPNIDAVNFVNNNIFHINLPGSSVLGNLDRPYYTLNTVNYTNFGTISGNVGFLFETYAPTADYLNQFRWASTFHNIGTISCGASTNVTAGLYSGFSRLLVSATNIYSPGIIYAGPDSFINMDGANVDINRGLVMMEGFTDLSPSNNTLGLFDNHWNASTNVGFIGAGFNAVYPTTPVYDVITRYNENLFMRMVLTNAVSYYSLVTDRTGSNRLHRAVFVQNTNATAQISVYLPTDSNNDPFYDPILLEWVWTNSPLFTSEQSVDYLYLVDDLAEPRRDIGLVLTGFSGPRPTYTPENYSFLRGGPRIFGYLPEVPSRPPSFGGGIITNTFTAYEALFQPTTVVPTDVSGQNATNMPGRIILSATNSLAMNFSSIIGPNTLEIKSPNHFLGNEGAQIAVPLASLDFRNTNGFLTMTNLMHPAIPRPEGTITLFSCRWTNVINQITNHYHVLFVDSRMAPNSPGRIQDLNLSATNLFISDILHITRSFLFDGEALTVMSNAPTARTPTGAIDLLSSDIVWSTAMPRLSNLTNHGTISTLNAVYFGGSRRQPYHDNSFNEPYNAFVNTGSVVDEGSLVWSRYFENRGSFRSASGSFSLESTTAVFRDSVIGAPGGDVNLTSGSLYVTNTVLNAGRRLNFTINNWLDDGGLTNGNFWVVGAAGSSVPGMSLILPQKPAVVNFLGTTITNISPARADFRITWDAEDLGAVPAGFTNNGAIGRLILDAKDENSSFSFVSASGEKAIYIDYLELRGQATRYDGSSNYTALNVAPGMKVYYAQAVDGNGNPLAVRLNGLNGGRLIWVPGYAGQFSSTTLIYPDGTTNRINTALATSCDLDSNGNGIPNCIDPAPVPPGAYSGTGGTTTPPIGGGGTDNGGTGTDGTGGDGTSDPVESITHALSYPGMVLAAENANLSFGAVSGVYSGLFDPPSGQPVNVHNAGYVTIKTTAKQRYTGKILMGGKTYPFSGAFNAQGLAQVTVKRRGLTPLAMELMLNLDAGDQIIGRVSSGTDPTVWSSGLIADRVVFNSKNRCPQEGFYNLAIPIDAEVTEIAGKPIGAGTGTLKIRSNGNVLLNTTLADGTKISQLTTISKEGVWPLYAAPYKGAGIIAGWIQMGVSGNDVFGGTLVWKKLPATAGKYYVGGFDATAQVVGSPYSPPRGANGVVPYSNGVLTLGGDRTEEAEPVVIPVSVQFIGKSKVISANPLFRRLVLTPSNGLFRGEILPTEGGKPLPYQGMFLQKQGLGYGFWWTANRCGSVTLTPLDDASN